MSYSLPDSVPYHVFRAYDIRGEVGKKAITASLAYAIGLALGTEVQMLGSPAIIVGRDGRLTSLELKHALVSGIQDTGTNVVDIGLVPTPLVYFATSFLPINSGVMITASHNPGHHNGFKIVLDGTTLSTQGIANIYQRITQRRFLKGHGKLTKKNIIPDYIQLLEQKISLKKRLKIVVDPGNGAASQLAPTLYRTLGCEVLELFCEIDGRFPNHHPDPMVPDNLKDLIKLVKEVKADLGLAFDGDADRLGVVTDDGKIIWPDRQMMLFSQDVLSRHPQSSIVFDVKCSNLLPKMIREWGGHPIMHCAGHSLMKARMKKENAILAGEMSGHIFFQDDWFGFDDGLYVGARLLKILSSDYRSISEIFSCFPDSVNTPELKLPLADDQKKIFMQKLLEESNFGEAQRITIDGLRLEFPHGWGLVRPSNTSPCLVLRFEGETKEDMVNIQECFRRELLKIDPKLKLPF